jgi:hypothetical protein
MAEEIDVTLTISASKQGRILPQLGGSYKADWTGKDYDEGIISAATTAAGVAFSLKSTLSAAGWSFFKNHDLSNYIDIGQQHSGTTFVPVLRLGPGEHQVVKLSSIAITDLYYRANTAAVDLQFRVQEP